MEASPAARIGARGSASEVVGISLTECFFLWYAFGSLDFLTGQVIGKGGALLPALPLVHLLRLRDRRTGPDAGLPPGPYLTSG